MRKRRSSVIIASTFLLEEAFVEDKLDMNARLLFRTNGTPLLSASPSKLDCLANEDGFDVNDLCSLLCGFEWSYIHDATSLSDVQAPYTFVRISTVSDLIPLSHVALAFSKLTLAL